MMNSSSQQPTMSSVQEDSIYLNGDYKLHDEESQQPEDNFLFTSESVGEGHPGKLPLLEFCFSSI